MDSERNIRILIADDHPIVRDGLIAVLSRYNDIVVVGEAANGQEALTLYRQQRPDVTLMDMRMPLMDGVAAVSAIHADNPNAAIVILTTYDGEEDVYRGLQAGARGYLLKDAPREELLATIRGVHAGQTCISPEMAGKLAARIHHAPLTVREFEVLQNLATGKSNLEIGRALFITEGTVKAHVNSILSKMAVSDRTQAVTMALKRGMIRLD